VRGLCVVGRSLSLWVVGAPRQGGGGVRRSSSHGGAGAPVGSRTPPLSTSPKTRPSHTGNVIIVCSLRWAAHPAYGSSFDGLLIVRSGLHSAVTLSVHRLSPAAARRLRGRDGASAFQGRAGYEGLNDSASARLRRPQVGKSPSRSAFVCMPGDGRQLPVQPAVAGLAEGEFRYR